MGVGVQEEEDLPRRSVGTGVQLAATSGAGGEEASAGIELTGRVIMAAAVNDDDLDLGAQSRASCCQCRWKLCGLVEGRDDDGNAWWAGRAQNLFGRLREL